MRRSNSYAAPCHIATEKVHARLCVFYYLHELRQVDNNHIQISVGLVSDNKNSDESLDVHKVDVMCE